MVEVYSRRVLFCCVSVRRVVLVACLVLAASLVFDCNTAQAVPAATAKGKASRRSTGDPETARSTRAGRLDRDAAWSQLLGEKSHTHEHWESLVRRSADYSWRYHGDDAASSRSEPWYYRPEDGIANVQDYYRRVFADLAAEEEREVAPLGGPGGGVHQEGFVGAAEYESKLKQSMDGVLEEEAVRGDVEDMASIEQNVLEKTELGKPRVRKIDGRYLVMLSEETSDRVLDRTVEMLRYANEETAGRLRADHFTVFRRVGKGFVATLNRRLLDVLWKHPNLVSVERDLAFRHVTHKQGSKPSLVEDEPLSSSRASEDQMIDEQSIGVPWNLDRLDQRSVELDGKYEPEAEGENVDVYVIDTGVRYSHQEFQGQVKYGGYDAIDVATGSSLRGSDCNGHGTHCAATIGGKYFGVAKRVNLYSVRGLDCTGTGAVSGIVAALEHIVDNAGTNPIVINLSLGLDESFTLDTAIQSVVNNHNIPCVAASGNDGKDTCSFSPASSGATIDVGATDKNDKIAYFSNVGPCTEVFAPGFNIQSASMHCDSCYRTMDGTSMACPHVAGYVAILRGINPKLTNKEITERVIEKSTKNTLKLDYVSGHSNDPTPNRLLYVPAKSAPASENDFE